MVSLLQVCPDPDAPPDAHSVAWCGAGQHRCFVDNDGTLELACVAPSDVDECWCGDAGLLPWILGGLALLCLCGVPFEVFDFLASRGKLFDTYFETVISDSVAVTARERRSDGAHDRLQTTVLVALPFQHLGAVLQASLSTAARSRSRTRGGRRSGSVGRTGLRSAAASTRG